MHEVSLYRDLIAAAARAGVEMFDAHVLAAILTVSTVKDEAPLALSEAEFAALIGDFVSGSSLTVQSVLLSAPNDEVAALRDLLMMYAGAEPISLAFAKLVAARCLRPNHLWQDLGLRDRSELSKLMARHFPGLALRNRGDMKWKRFLYRMICSAEGFSYCAAPMCSECSDFKSCFGAEDGASLLAVARSVLGEAKAYSMP